MRGIYFFDELDAIGSQRGLANDVGEIRRVLNSFGHDHRLGQNRRSLDGAELAKRNPGSSGRNDDHGQHDRYLANQ